MGKPRDLANVVATGNILADGAVAPAELTGVNATAAELNILDGVTATASELNLLDGVTATTAELNHVDGVTSNVQTQMDTKAPVASPTFTGTATAPTVNASTALQIGGVAVTATAAELNKMDGVTVSASDINSVTTKAPTADPTFTGTATAPTINASTALQIGGAAITSTAAELNILDGVTATAAELNYVDGVTSNVQTQINTKAPTADPTFTGTLAAPTINATTAIQAGGTNVITSSRQLANIASIDSTTVAALNAAGVGGGGGIELTTSEAVVEGDTLAMDFTTGKVKKVARVGGNGKEYAYNSNSGANMQIFDIIHIPEIDKMAILASRSDGQKVIQVGTHNGSSWTWGTPYQGDSGGSADGGKLAWAANVNRLVAVFRGSSNSFKYRMVSVSGNNVTNEGGGTILSSDVDMGSSGNHAELIYSPTHQKLIAASVGNSGDRGYSVFVGTPSSSSISWTSRQGPGNVGTYQFVEGGQVRCFGMAVNGTEFAFGYYDNTTQRYYLRAGTLSGTTFTFGSANNIGSGYTYAYQSRGQMFHLEHIGSSGTFAYKIMNTNQDTYFRHFTISGTTISAIDNYITGPSNPGSNGAMFAYDPDNDRLYSFKGNTIEGESGTNSTRLGMNNNNNTQSLHGVSSLIRSATFDEESGLAFAISQQNPTYIYYYHPITDNYHYFIGTATEAASANSTVKIATVGNIATGLSGLTPGSVYKINFNGAFQQHAGVTGYNYAFGESQRARSHMVALTATTGLITNSFSQDL